MPAVVANAKKQLTMKKYEWDPLQHSSDKLDAEILSAAKKRQIKNILKSYVGTYDPFSEMIQNSMDAVDHRKSILNEKGYKKRSGLLSI